MLYVDKHVGQINVLNVRITLQSFHGAQISLFDQVVSIYLPSLISWDSIYHLVFILCRRVLFKFLIC